jgi:energy-coupling factor transporter ATP-binding protein EcfA2
VTLTLQEVGYRYAGSTSEVLHDVSLTLEPGVVVGVVGANDAGKSTLCLVAAGLAPASIGGELRGEVRIDEISTRGARPDALAQRCGILFQNPATQLSGTSPTVWEEVAFGPRNVGLPLDEVIERVTWALGAVGVSQLADRDPEHLSGGQAQLVALAGVLALRPAYLLLDEPTSQLDPLGTQLVGEAIAELTSRTGSGVLLIEHKTDLLARISDRVVVLADGEVALAGSTSTVLADPRLDGWGIEPPSTVRLTRAAEVAGVDLPLDGAAA